MFVLGTSSAALEAARVVELFDGDIVAERDTGSIIFNREA